MLSGGINVESFHFSLLEYVHFLQWEQHMTDLKSAALLFRLSHFPSPVHLLGVGQSLFSDTKLVNQRLV